MRPCLINLRLASLFAVVAGVMLVESSLFAQINTDSDPARPREPQMLLLDHARDTLVDPGERREAVQSLLEHGSEVVVRQLVAAMKMNGDRAFQRVIAQAVARTVDPPPAQLAQPMLDLLASADEALALDLGQALGRYDSDNVLEALMSVALDPQAQINHRRAAIRPLGLHRSQHAADVLMKLTEVSQPEPIRAAAFEALAQLSGIGRFGAAADKWRRWWETHRALTPQKWFALLTKSFARQNRRLAADNQQIRERLLQTVRQLYHATVEEKREALLINMLAEHSPAMRRLAVELMAQRFIDQQVFGPELLKATIAALDDTSVAVRAGASRLLLDLDNADGADVMARRLVDGSETAPEVLRIYLLMMADQPRARAIDRAMQLLDDERLRDAAAGVLASAAERQILTESEQSHLHRQLRGMIGDDTPPLPKVVELLGYVGDDQDWQRIEQWLESEQDEVKVAAAWAWARSTQPLDVLAKRAADPSLQRVFMTAANQRGSTAATLIALVEHPPESEHSVATWERALVAVAQRAPAADVVRAHGMLAQDESALGLREQMLTASIGAALPAGNGNGNGVEPASASVLADLMLARAQVRLLGSEPKAALADLAVIEARHWALDDARAARRDALTMTARLHAGDPSGAFSVAADVLDKARQSGEDVFRQAAARIAKTFLDAAERHVEANQLERARFLIIQLDETLGAALPVQAGRRIEQLRERVDGMMADADRARTSDAGAAGDGS